MSKIRKKLKQSFTILMTLAMILTFIPLVAGADGPLDPPANVRITSPGATSQAVAWDAVAGATGYIVYAFESATETNTANAVGSQARTAAQTTITIGSGENLTCTTQQQFTVPLPGCKLYFRVQAIAEDAADNSALSDASAAAKPGRRVNSTQVSALINDQTKIWNTSGKGFVMIDVRGGDSTTTSRVMGNIDIPQNNVSGTNPIFSLQSSRDFFDRVMHELKAHPAYNGPDTLIFIH